MEKSTKLIIAAVGLGGLGFFLYKKGLFGGKTTEVAKKVEPKVEPKVVVQPVGDSIPPVSVFVPEPVYVPIWAQTEIYPADVVYPEEVKLVKEIVTQDIFNPYLYDQPPVEDRIVKIDYTSDRYNNGIISEYAERDLDNIRFNKLLYV
jgi:hypothetical protein